MITYFRELFTDKTAFVRFVRALLGAGGAFVIAHPDMLASVPKWIPAALVFGALFLKSGDPNPTPSELRQQLDKP